MTDATLNTISTIALAISITGFLIAWFCGEWSVKSINDALNDAHGDVPNLDRHVVNQLHNGTDQ